MSMSPQVSWLFFRVARSTRINLDMGTPTASPARTASPATHFEHNDITIIFETVH
jgi:hypothetical protein